MLVVEVPVSVALECLQLIKFDAVAATEAGVTVSKATVVVALEIHPLLIFCTVNM